ncbi:MAG TPA: DUF883 family protein [Steroidobacteraceae bacterium]|nr:DUF883 family protein [Steroidobacteraceae bacterium]
MNSTASDAAQTYAQAGREAAADFQRRSAESKAYISEELRAFIADVEELLKKVANVSDVEIARVRNKVATALSDVRRVANETADGVRDRARVAMDATDDYVRDRPWTAIGIAAALGLLVGIGVSAATRNR